MGKLTIGDSFATALYHADGNGNVTCMIYTNQTIVAKYLYDPYGNMLAMSGPLAGANTYRFSSKEWDEDAGLYYYGYRFYDPEMQRWVNRDPFPDEGFEADHWGIVFEKTDFAYIQPDQLLEDPNLYDFVVNDPIDDFDNSGLSPGTGHGGGPPAHGGPGRGGSHSPPSRQQPRPGCHSKADCHKQYLGCVDVGIVVCGGSGFIPVVGIPVGIGCGIFFNHFCDKQEQECEATATN
ncbi:MAG: RHS repeat-associated core domain-containing protein [Verrucomicrobia bacterium]|nr:RHS repeat-associated core domain-containing protein [Verrucomicrobiota bacterium]